MHDRIPLAAEMPNESMSQTREGECNFQAETKIPSNSKKTFRKEILGQPLERQDLVAFLASDRILPLASQLTS
jgi:hypothetical protein